MPEERRVALYDAASSHRVPWPDTAQGRFARDFLTPLLAEGIQSFVANAAVSLKLLVVGDRIVPIGVTGAQRFRHPNAFSPHSTYIRAPMAQLAQLGVDPWKEQVMAAGLGALGRLLLAGGIGQVVWVDFWLGLAFDPATLDANSTAAITRFLTERFPDHAIAFWSADSDRDAGFLQTLGRGGYRFLYRRVTHVWRPRLEGLSKGERRHLREDARCLMETDYQLRPPAAGAVATERASRLFRATNFDKYPESIWVVPMFTSQFFAHVARRGGDRVFLRAAEGDAGVDGFVLYLLDARCGQCVFVAYDQEKPKELGLYRMLFMVPVREALRRGVSLDAGPGVHDYKRFRGFRTSVLYRAVYTDHLAPHRRAAWRLLERYANDVLCRSVLKTLGEGDVARDASGRVRIIHGADTEEVGVAQALEMRLEALRGLDGEQLPQPLARLEELVGLADDLLGNETGLRQTVAELRQHSQSARRERGRGQIALDPRGLAAFVGEAEQIAGTRVVLGGMGEVTPRELRSVGDHVRGSGPSVAAVLTANEGDRVHVLVTVTEDLVSCGVSASAALAVIIDTMGGAGGGSATTAQGGGGDPSRLPQALESVRSWFRAALNSPGSQ